MSYGINPNFTVSAYPCESATWENETVIQEFPYRDHATYSEQRERALALYEKLAKDTSRIVTLTRLAVMDLEEGEFAPTLLRKSSDPDYVYDGFAGI